MPRDETDTREVETNDGSIILINDDDTWTPPDTSGRYGPDELRDIAAALEGDHAEDEEE